LRAEGLGAPGFLGVPLASVDRGNALVISVEKESITIRLAFGGAFDAVRCVRRASKCARLGVEKWVKFERRDESVASSDGAELDVVGLCEVKICVSRDPEMGCEASIQTTPSPPCKALAAICIPMAVFPTPGGP